MGEVFNETSGVAYATLSDAIAASVADDVLVLAPGAYVEDFPDIRHSLTIQCIDGMASLTRATPLTPDGRAILNVVEAMAVNLTVIGLEIFGGKRPGPDTNGAAILHERGNGNLTIERCTIRDNENGILVGSANEFSPPGGVNVVIRDSEFSNNGAPVNSVYAAGGKCHNIYINAATSVLIEDNYIHSVFSQGHQIKSRAASNIIINNRIEDLPQLTATGYGSSYSIDLPNGGVAVIEGNIIEKGPYSVSKFFIHYVGEGQRYAENSLLVTGNQFVNAGPDDAKILLSQLDTTVAPGIPISVVGNSYSGTAAFNFTGNIFVAGAGDESLAGTAGVDSLEGGLGNDMLRVDHPGDVVKENAAEGTDTVLTTLAAYTLGLNVENLTHVGEADFAGTGNTLANVIAGGAGDDTLHGATGSDTLRGGAGNDLFFVNDIADLVEEAAGEGTDTISASLSYALPEEVEALILTGTTAVSATGNASDNILVGNAANNLLSGGLGNDTLSGADGRDTLIGGAGADSLAGGTGNDTYVVDADEDAVAESLGGGIDLVQTALATHALAAEVENLTFTGAGAFVGSGNAAANLILGGAGADSLSGGLANDTVSGAAGADTLDGGGGADSLSGGLGDDSYVVGEASDIVLETTGGGTDTVRTTLGAHTLAANVEALVFIGTGDFAGTGNTLANTLTGGDGADTLNGAAGADTLAGGLGDDTYVLDSALDVVVEAPGGGADTLRTTLAVLALGAAAEHLIYTGASGFRGTGNATANRITGGNGADTLDGGAGADTLTGGAGNDLYLVDDFGDVVVDSAGTLDTVQTALTAYNLAVLPTIERLTYSGTAGFAGNGNALANRLAGGVGEDTLDGGAGADTLVGGFGDDTYIVSDAADVVQEATGGGTDIVRTALAAHTLAAYVEALVFAGIGDFTGTGNTLANTLTGGGGADTLNGAAGADTLAGGLGDDTYVLDSALDVVVEAPGGGTDTLRTALAMLTLGAEVEHLAYTGSSGFRGTGNAADNRIAGGNGADTLDGGAGGDTLTGGAGNDLYRVDNTGDVVGELAGGGVDTVQTALAAFGLAGFAEVEMLAFVGSGGFAGTGNALANRLTGGAGDDTLDGGAGADTLTGGAGLDSFRFLAGEADGDTVTDFAGAGALAGDTLLLVGFGTAAAGAQMVRLTATDWHAISADGLTIATIRLANAAALHATDYAFA